MDAILQFLYRGLTVMCVAVGVFFLHFWHMQRDRFFMWFAVAFWSFGVSWGVHVVNATPSESGPNVARQSYRRRARRRSAKS